MPTTPRIQQRPVEARDNAIESTMFFVVAKGSFIATASEPVLTRLFVVQRSRCDAEVTDA
jgi:hypothetical protein